MSNKLLVMTLDTKDVTTRIGRYAAAFPLATAESLVEAGNQTIVPATREEILAADNVWTGRLLNSIKGQISEVHAYSCSIQIGSFDVPYAADVHEGLPPGTEVDRDRIIAWLRQTNAMSEEAAKAVANRIVIRIQEDGTKSYPFLEQAFAKEGSNFVRRALAILQRRMGF